MNNLALFVLLDLWAFFIMYVASMGMIRAHKEGNLNIVLWVLCLPFVAISWVFDVINNATLFTLIFFEIPRELTVTERLKRHYKKPTIRGKIATWIGVTILNPFDYSNDHLD
jgi:hypothetical protein